MEEKLRIDKYLWSIRLFKTRSLATDACASGKVKWNGNNVKASKTVALGEEYEVRTEANKWLIKVPGLLYNRAAYSEAIKYYLDLTPEEESTKPKFQPVSFHTGKRQSKIGRPTKQQRRDIDAFLTGED
mgnify:FL=1